ncbi:P-loop containing nucleoside triphosphate hydrolase protein [Aulographum hederae CBS 113979]|uniref:P-loop containing nucleoside triphosphate hydrolase protein n=1 Tax=Aulographum hederae CBS 113979 TaxID=1176131 RepID=A0A6G1HF58_9PEZI|nr:P-loop containing nucleoside triphosphate hydrolase protein [Aulographum hederae CBS 113979]
MATFSGKPKPKPKTILVALSGPSSSGKTTLARLLRDALSPHIPTFILHEDDFYLPDAQIPIHNGLEDWDCVESLDLADLERTLTHVKEHGALPPGHKSKEDRNSVGEVGVSDAVKAEIAKDAGELFKRINNSRKEGGDVTVALIDGFLLLLSPPLPESIPALFTPQLKLFLRTTHATTKRRREARSGYVTLEGFWEDPPGYVDKIVWPNYVEAHQYLFLGGDVEGELDESVCEREGIRGMPRELEDGGRGIAGVFRWAWGVLKEGVERECG